METQRLKYYRQPLLANPPAPAGLPEGMLLLAERPIKHVPLNLHLNWKPTGQSVSSYMCKLGCSQNKGVKYGKEATGARMAGLAAKGSRKCFQYEQEKLFGSPVWSVSFSTMLIGAGPAAPTPPPLGLYFYNPKRGVFPHPTVSGDLGL